MGQSQDAGQLDRTGQITTIDHLLAVSGYSGVEASMSRPTFIVYQLADIVGNWLTEEDLHTLSAEDARLLASRMEFWATKLFNYANQSHSNGGDHGR